MCKSSLSERHSHEDIAPSFHSLPEGMCAANYLPDLAGVWCAAQAAAVTGQSLVLNDALLKVVALGRNKTTLQRLSSIDARVVPVLLTPDEAPLQSLQAALDGKQVSSLRP